MANKRNRLWLMTLPALCKGQFYNKAGLQLFSIEGAKYLSHVLSRSDHAAMAVGTREVRGLWGALNTATLLCDEWVSRSWRTSWDNQELRCKWWRYHFWPPTESCIRDSSPDAGRNVAHHASKWTRSFQGEMIWAGKPFRGFHPNCLLFHIGMQFPL